MTSDQVVTFKVEDEKKLQIVAKIIVQTIFAVLAFIPFWFYLLIWHFTKPEGFWQKIVLVGAGLVVLGAIQIIFIVVFVALSLVIWLEA